MNFDEISIRSQYEDRKTHSLLTEADIILIFDKYDQLLRRYSWTINGFDHDLYSECKITFLKCIKKFQFDEEHFIELFQFYLHTSEKIG